MWNRCLTPYLSIQAFFCKLVWAPVDCQGCPSHSENMQVLNKTLKGKMPGWRSEMRLIEQSDTSYLGDNTLKSYIAPEKLTKMQHTNIFCFHLSGHPSVTLLPRTWKLDSAKNKSIAGARRRDNPADEFGELEDATTQHSSVLLLTTENRRFSSMYKSPWRWHHRSSVLVVKTPEDHFLQSLGVYRGWYLQLASFHLWSRHTAHMCLHIIVFFQICMHWNAKI